MNLDPTYDYSTIDLSDEKNLVRWKFCELIKNLIILSSPAKRQMEITGMGAVCDEMAIDFDTYFTLSHPTYLDNQLLTPDQAEKLKEIDVYFADRSGDKFPEFWDDSLLDTNLEWQVIREKATRILEMLGLQDFTVEFDRTSDYEITKNRGRIISESTKTRIVRKTKTLKLS